MNNQSFKGKLEFELNHFEIDFDFLTDWYLAIVKDIENAYLKSQKIKHPRHKGDHLEDSLIDVFDKLLPKRFKITKGFAINIDSFKSKELDLIIYDSEFGGAFASTESTEYIPIELVTACVEIKSNLNLQELRKSILNCVSLKKLNYSDFTYKTKNRTPFFGIFAYNSTTNSTNFLKELNDSIYNIPQHLRPNFIYIHKQGLYIPKTNNELLMVYEHIYKSEEEFGIIPALEKNKLNAQLLFLFFTYIIQHSLKQIEKPCKIDYFNYINKSLQWKNNITKVNEEKPLPKFIRNKSITIDSNNQIYYSVFITVCPKCGTENKFIPENFVSSKKRIEDLIKKNPYTQQLNDINNCAKCGEKIYVKKE